MAKRETLSITIRLPIELVKWMDSKVNGVEYRNRTYIVEKALIEFKSKKN